MPTKSSVTEIPVTRHCPDCNAELDASGFCGCLWHGRCIACETPVPAGVRLCLGCADTVASDWMAFDLQRALRQLGLVGGAL